MAELDDNDDNCEDSEEDVAYFQQANMSEAPFY